MHDGVYFIGLIIGFGLVVLINRKVFKKFIKSLIGSDGDK